MRCPFCTNPDSRVLDTRSLENNTLIRRRRECCACQKRFTTYERIESIPLAVIKKDGRRVPFDKNKLISGMLKACYKRPVPTALLQEKADELEKILYQAETHEVSTVQIGEAVMRILKGIDQVAYVRFASVYREFKDIGSFMDEVQSLLSDGNEHEKN